MSTPLFLLMQNSNFGSVTCMLTPVISQRCDDQSVGNQEIWDISHKKNIKDRLPLLPVLRMIFCLE